MYDYLSEIFYGQPIYHFRPTPLDEPDSKLSGYLTQVREEMGDKFANRLTDTLKIEFTGLQKDAFCDGTHLGSQLAACLFDLDS